MARVRWTYITAAAFITGCSAQPQSSASAMTGTQRLQATARKLENDPSSSPEIKRMMAGVLQQTQTQQQVDDMENNR